MKTKGLVYITLMQLLFAFITASVFIPLLYSEDQKKPTTLDNLLAAYNGESNAHARYAAFATKADEEGYTKAATLFRAASRAEQVHAGIHAEEIKKLGGTPKADIAKPEVRSTKENLATALEGETYEKDVMYPSFLKQAKSEKKAGAVRAFNFAKTAEVEHARMYDEALNNLSQWKEGKKDFYVCSVCGFTVEKIDFAKCPVCFNPKEKYEKID